jgi:hypothetical protein
MATQICNVLNIHLTLFNSATAVADRTYTATRQLRLYDFKVFQVTNAAEGVNVITVSNGGTVCITLTTSDDPDLGDLFRLGQNVLDTVDDSQMVVAAGGTCVFACDDPASVSATLFAYPL